jgi:hypothetical protein
MASIQASYDHFANPVDMVEHIATVHDWTFERSAPDELTMSVAGSWCDYHLSLTWRDDLQALHLACAFDFRVTKARLTEIYRLMAQKTHAEQCEGLLKAALEACERYYQSFQFVLWAGRSADEALAATMLETQGHA